MSLERDTPHFLSRFVDITLAMATWIRSAEQPPKVSQHSFEVSLNDAYRLVFAQYDMLQHKDTEIAKLRGLLREVEWVPAPDDFDVWWDQCRFCQAMRIQDGGHAPDCTLAAALGDGT